MPDLPGRGSKTPFHPRGILPRVTRTRKRSWAKTLTLTAALLAVAWWLSHELSLWSPYAMRPGRLPPMVVLPKDGPPNLWASAVRPSPDPINIVVERARAYPIEIGSREYCVIWMKFPQNWQSQSGFAGQLRLCVWGKNGIGMPLPSWIPGRPLILMNFTQTQFDALVGKPLPQSVVDALLNANANPPPANAVTVPWP